MVSASDTEDELHAAREHLIDEEKEHRRYDHHGEDHGGRNDGLLAGRPGHTTNFLSDLPQKFERRGFCHHKPLEGGLYSSPARILLAPAPRFRARNRVGARPGRSGGARTPNPRFWRPVLYQLSYTPIF